MKNRGISEASAQLLCDMMKIPRERLPKGIIVASEDEPPEAQSRIHPATAAVVACTEYTRDGECGCNGRRCNRSGELVMWQECLDCKAEKT